MVKDGSVWLWDAETLALLDRIESKNNSDSDHNDNNNDSMHRKKTASLTTRATISYDGNFIVLYSENSQQITVMSTSTSAVIRTFSIPFPARGIYSAMFIRKSYKLLVLCNDGTIRIITNINTTTTTTIHSDNDNDFPKVFVFPNKTRLGRNNGSTDSLFYFGSSMSLDSRCSYLVITTSDGSMRLFDFKVMMKNMVVEKKDTNNDNKVLEKQGSKNRSDSKSKSGPKKDDASKNIDSLAKEEESVVLFEVSKDIQITEAKLDSLLVSFGCFPSKYRVMIWKMLLQLPLNQYAFNIIAANYKNKNKSSKRNNNSNEDNESRDVCSLLRDVKLRNHLDYMLHCLSNWCSLFANVSFLPNFVFPFIKSNIFHINVVTNNNIDDDVEIKSTSSSGNSVACFETIATILLNECDEWFEMFPYQPVKVLAKLEQVLGEKQ